MFFRLVLIVPYLTICCILNGQKVIELTRDKCSSPIVQEVDESTSICLKIEGFNPLIYKFQVDSQDTFDRKIQTKSLLSSLASSTGISTLFSSIQDVLLKTIPPPTQEEDATVLDLKINDQRKSINISSIQENQNSKNCFEQAQHQIMLLSPELRDTLKALENTTGGNLFVLCHISKTILTTRKIALDIELAMQQLQNEYLPFDILRKKWSYGNIKGFGFDYSEFRKKLISLNNQYKQVLLKNTEISNSTVVKENEILKSFNSAVKILIDKEHIAIKQIDSLTSYENYIKLAADMENYTENPYYKSLPFQLNGTKKIIKVKISPYDASYAAPSYETTIILKKKKGIEFALCGGFYYGNRGNFNYSTKSLPSGKFIPVKENTTDYQFGISTMAHVIGMAGLKNLQFGVGPTLAFQKNIIPGIAFGLGTVFGKANKIMITGGMNLTYVKRLSAAHSPIIELESPQENYTVDKTKGMLFISVGYNFLTF